MKKIIIFVPVTVLVFITMIFINGKISMSNSEAFKDNKQISVIIDKYSTEFDHEIQLATKEMEQRLYGKWQIGHTLGYSLKYDVTGGALDNGKLDISKEMYSIITPSAVYKNVEGKRLTTGDFKDYATDFKNPIFAYYQETLEQMKQDDFLDNYSGIEGLEPDTVGTIVIAMGLPSDSSDKYEFIMTKFIIIDDYVIAVRQSTFYELEQINP